MVSNNGESGDTRLSAHKRCTDLEKDMERFDVVGSFEKCTQELAYLRAREGAPVVIA